MSAAMLHPNDLLLRDAQRSFVDREANAIAQVSEWRFGQAPRVSLLPLHDERAHPHARAGRMFAQARKIADGVVEYGHDAAGRLRVVREHALRGQKGLLHELVLVEYAADAVRWSVHHESVGRSVREVGTTRISGGVEIEAHIVTPHVSTEERYSRDPEGRIVAIDVHREMDWAHPKRARVVSTHFTVQRDAAGKVERVDFDDGRTHGVTYQRPRAGGTRTSADALVDAIVRATLVRAARPSDAEPAFALAISWSPAQPLPPLVSLGLVSDRARLDNGAPGDVWAPTEWATSLAVHDDPEVAATSAELSAAGADTPFVLDTLRRAAATLRRRDLSAVLPTTSDFVVIAIDWHQMELDRALRDAR